MPNRCHTRQCHRLVRVYEFIAGKGPREETPPTICKDGNKLIFWHTTFPHILDSLFPRDFHVEAIPPGMKKVEWNRMPAMKLVAQRVGASDSDSTLPGGAHSWHTRSHDFAH